MTRELAQHSQAKCGNCGRQGNQSKSRLRSYIYKTGDSQCDLCLTKKTCIALHNMAPRKLVILPAGCQPFNIRTEIMNGCPHKINYRLMGRKKPASYHRDLEDNKVSQEVSGHRCF